MSAKALTGAQVYDGSKLIDGVCVVVEGGVPRVEAAPPTGVSPAALSGGVIMPGFVDLQVNGGGGVMLGDAPHEDGLRRIAEAHYTLGTRQFLPTLITDRADVAAAAIDAVASTNVPGVLGLHLEGPHLDPAAKGAHDAALIRPMTDADVALYSKAADRISNLLITLAPCAATPEQIAQLTAAGVIVSLGHTACSYGEACAAFAAGARGITHLFNAMGGVSARVPGLVGAALDTPGVSIGLIADGIHVHPTNIRIALKAAKGELFLISDSMACAGTEMSSFQLGGREISRAGGRLTLADGTLAGADLNLAQAVETMVNSVGRPLEETLARVTRYPAALLRKAGHAGGWPDTADDLIYLGPDFSVKSIAELG